MIHKPHGTLPRETSRAMTGLVVGAVGGAALWAIVIAAVAAVI